MFLCFTSVKVSLYHMMMMVWKNWFKSLYIAYITEIKYICRKCVMTTTDKTNPSYLSDTGSLCSCRYTTELITCTANQMLAQTDTLLWWENRLKTWSDLTGSLNHTASAHSSRLQTDNTYDMTATVTVTVHGFISRSVKILSCRSDNDDDV